MLLHVGVEPRIAYLPLNFTPAPDSDALCRNFRKLRDEFT